jgi:hypothetical protein
LLKYGVLAAAVGVLLLARLTLLVVVVAVGRMPTNGF